MKEKASYVLIIALFVVILISCKEQKRRITGNFNHLMSGETVYFYQSGKGIKDSCIVEQEGSVAFDFIPKELDIYGFKFSDEVSISFFMDSGDVAYFKGDIKDIYETTICTGSEEASAHIELYKEIHKIERQDQQDYERKNTFLETFIDNNPGRMSNMLAVSRLTSGNAKEYYLKVAASLQQIAPNHRMVKEIVKSSGDQALFPGDRCPNILLKDTNGNNIELRSIESELILIDFWGSFCIPCRQLHPRMKEIYNKYKTSGFEILAVSTDRRVDKWKEAIREDEINWLQVIDDPKGTTRKNFSLVYMPFNYLVSGDGLIVARNINENELVSLLEKRLVTNIIDN